MRIVAVKTFLVHERNRKNYLFIKVETEEGLCGWGEAFAYFDAETALVEEVGQLSRYLIGRSPFNIKHFVEIAYNDFSARRGTMGMFCALSGIEQAMWDIVGKAVNQPVYNLLGGACRPKIRLYANGWFYGAKSLDDYARAAERVLKQGFTALKFYPFQKGAAFGALRSFVPKEHIDRAVQIVKAVRNAIGPETDMMIDIGRRLAPMHAVQLAERLEAYRLFWFEEPCDVQDLDGLIEIRNRTKLPIVTGETLCGKAQFRPVLERRAANIINPDVTVTGGILELKEIAAMAEPYHVAVAPHNFNSTILGLASNVQAVATMPNFIILEYFVPFAETGRKLGRQLEPEGGSIPLPEGPGLGVEIDEIALADFPYKQFDKRSFPTYLDEEI
jgi:galactonate dehydratase